MQLVPIASATPFRPLIRKLCFYGKINLSIKLVQNPPNPFESTHREWLGPPPQAKIEVFEERAKSIVAKNESPDIPFQWSVNPYRGCQHACAYCYARPYHEFLGFGAGTDFDSKIVVKVNAAELLEARINKRSWRGELLNFSGVTDCYQPYESVYRVTRACLEVCRARRNPVGVVTKAFLIVRDIDVLSEIAATAEAHVFFSIPFADTKSARLIEPGAPPPQQRFEAMRRLVEAGIRVGVFVAPIIPGLNESDIPTILERAAEAGATSASYTALRLPGSVEQVFLERVREALPLRADRIEHRLRDIRGGSLNDAAFGRRMTGSGTYWESVKALFEISLKRFGLVSTSALAATDETRQSETPRAGASRAESPRAEMSQMTLPFDF
jgi:DNA repair photolyase